jgi:hypothetical protein
MAMLIEFVGCSGAGKTTVSEQVLAALSERNRTAGSSTALIATATHTAWIKNLFVRNICLDILLLPWLLLALKHHFRFCLFGLFQIVRHADSGLSMLQRVLSQLRNMAGNELLRRLPTLEFILVDEGTVCGVHNVLVHLKQDPAKAAIQAYARLVPKPDLVIHINTPVELALSRTKARADPPLRFHGLSDRLRFVSFAHETHLQLGRCREFSGRWYVTCSTEHPVDRRGRTTGEIVRAILSRRKEPHELRTA